MNDDQLNDLFRRTREQTPDTTRAEFAFETRMLARIRAERDERGSFFAWAWRLWPVFACIAILLDVWMFATKGDTRWRETLVASSGDQRALIDYFNETKI